MVAGQYSLLCLSIALAAVASAQDNTVLAGVYTSAQATRGQNVYKTQCLGCHKDDLTGINGPPLKGSTFLNQWREFPVEVLYKAIQDTMPMGRRGSLAPEEYLDLVTYILQQNEIPEGSKELTWDLLPKTLLVGKNGPQPVPTSSPVDVVGCLTQGPGGWYAASASEPKRTLNMWEISAEEFASAQKQALGRQAFFLQNLGDIEKFRAGDAVDAKIEVKGTLVRSAQGDRINTTAVRKISPDCE